MKRFAVFGASGFGREVMALVQRQSMSSIEPCEFVFVDDNPPAEVVNGNRVLNWSQWCSVFDETGAVCIAIGSSTLRERLVQRCENAGMGFFAISADNVVQLDDVTIGEGSILCPFVTMTSNIRIGRHFHANLYCYVAHDCVIGDFVTFAPGVKCNGNIVIEDHAYIGTGAILKQGKPGEPLVIGRGATVGMGAVVTKSVPPGVTVVGNPARPLAK